MAASRSMGCRRDSEIGNDVLFSKMMSDGLSEKLTGLATTLKRCCKEKEKFHIVQTKNTKPLFCRNATSSREQEQFGVRRYPKWHHENIKNETLLWQMTVAPGINSCMCYIGVVFIHFPFIVLYENLSSISFLCEGASKSGMYSKAHPRKFLRTLLHPKFC